ncbi:MAG: glutamate--tRNA ligase [Leptospiraceae bacterium]|nr:glutamate--tRNA ligase [Leptospiraceae bacterium]
MEVRTRFAPSPSGFLHVGGARTALFNYLYAKSKGGKFILRIEDTDQDRSTEASFNTILESLKWMGTFWDEGPEVGGEFGPYKQSERLDIYKKFTDLLLEKDLAYRCFCTPEELEVKKEQAQKMGIPYIYDGMYANLTKEEIKEKLKSGLPYAIRFRTKAKTLIVNDLIQGKVKFDTKLIGDFIIVKSDGFPSYNYAVVIDDFLMKITHVIRGVGHLSNTPRQVLIGEAFEFPIPEFAHVSEIVGSDGKKLSKRAGATSILAFRDLGYTSECFTNYMALLGWTSEDGEEYLPNKKAEKIFDVERCSKSPSMFDVFKKMKEEEKESVVLTSLSTQELSTYMNPKSKLNWLSNRYIRDMDLEELAQATIPFLESFKSIPDSIKVKSNETLQSILSSIRVYLDKISDAPPYIAEFFLDKISLEDEEAKTVATIENSKLVIVEFYKQLKLSEPKTGEEFKLVMEKTGTVTNEKGKNLFMPIRVATTGKLHGLELPILFPLLGVDKLLVRIESIAKEIELELK